MDVIELESDLKGIVGDRVTTSPFECWFYASDIVAIPAWVRQVFTTTPVAVVKPVSTEEVAAILGHCAQKLIPVVPRGAGTSGLFGAVPKKGGVVIDLRSLQDVTEIDKENLTVRAGTGITWWELDRRLRKEGLTLMSYPSSAFSATVGGWIMGSGLGIGTLKYGPVFDQLLAGTVALPDGSQREYEKGQGLEAFFESEGILGIMTRVLLKVRRLPERTAHYLLYFARTDDLFRFVADLAGRSPTPYDIEVADHSYLGLVKESGYEVTVPTGSGGTVLVTYEGSADEERQGKEAVESLSRAYRGELRDGAREEWGHRFNMLRIRRAVPTIMPIGVHVPLTRLGEFYTSLAKIGKRRIGLLGHIISKKEAMMMAMVVTDSREKLEYSLSFHVPSRIFDLALSLGGGPGGGVGVWNSPYAGKILSRERSQALRRMKRDLDPKGVMNPGVWPDVSPLFAPLMYKLGMKAAAQLDRVIPSPKVASNCDNGIEACVQCGYCMNYCPTRGEWVSSTPRGRILMARALSSGESQDKSMMSPEYLKDVFDCSLCGRCRVDCSVGINSPEMWADLRSRLVKEGAELDSLKMVAKVLNETRNTAAKKNDQRLNWSKSLKLQQQTGEKPAEVVYFVGCVTSFYPMVQDIARSFARILERAGIAFTLLGGEEWCCGYPLISAGHPDEAITFMRHNVQAVKDTGARTVAVTCPGCYRMWKKEFTHMTSEKLDVEVLHSTELILRLLKEKRIAFKELNDTVTYHDPCDLGRVGGIYDQPRSIIQSMPGITFSELEDNREHANCCGSGGDLLASNQELALRVAQRRVREASETGAKTLVTACPSCVRSMTMAKNAEKMALNIMDIAQLAWKAMGG